MTNSAHVLKETTDRSGSLAFSFGIDFPEVHKMARVTKNLSSLQLFRSQTTDHCERDYYKHDSEAIFGFGRSLYGNP